MVGLQSSIPGLVEINLLGFLPVQQEKDKIINFLIFNKSRIIYPLKNRNGIVKRQSQQVLGVRFEMVMEQDPTEENSQIFENPAEKLQEIMDEGGRKKIADELAERGANFTIDENVAVEAVLSRMISEEFRKRLKIDKIS